ncbi:MAG: cupin domain-containing protein [Actinomycetota bacterium]|nr:cupin domain-containing protein [Actinomycetota bacterium]
MTDATDRIGKEAAAGIVDDTLGDGILDVTQWAVYSTEGGQPIRMYTDQDMSITVWNLLPGQEHSAHLHPERAHVMVVVCGTGMALIGEERKEVPLKTGDYYIAPRTVVHGILNTGTGPLSYSTISNNNMVNVAVPVGEQQHMVR